MTFCNLQKQRLPSGGTQTVFDKVEKFFHSRPVDCEFRSSVRQAAQQASDCRHNSITLGAVVTLRRLGRVSEWNLACSLSVPQSIGVH